MGPFIKSGKFHAGTDLVCGDNVVIDVAEEVIVGDRCVLPDNAYLGGRRITIGDDFYGYSWEWQRLDVGRGRRDEEHAVLTVGKRCTFHNNRIDLAQSVLIGDDVGLSPDVYIYTHYYWMSPLLGYPKKYTRVKVGNRVLVGFRSVILPGACVGDDVVVGAQSVVTGLVGYKMSELYAGTVWAGCPAVQVGVVETPPVERRKIILDNLLKEYAASCTYRNFTSQTGAVYPLVFCRGIRADVETLTVHGEEDEYTDDLREFLFKRGIRLYTKRPFRKLSRIR